MVTFLRQIVSRLPIVIALIALLGMSVCQLAAQDDQDLEPLTVVTKEIEPFVFVDGQQVKGFSIDLWQALAKEMDVAYEFEIVDTVQEQLDIVETNLADVAIAAISITSEREEIIDFSHQYFESGLGILTLPGTSTPLLDTFRQAFSPNILRLIALLLISILLASHIIWLIERSRNPEFPRSYFKGIWESIWWATITVTTVGYGDKVPAGRLGRLFGLFWVLSGLIIIALFTAGVTAQLTVQELQGAINGPEDLPGKRIATVAGSTSDAWLEEKQIGHRTVATIEEAYELLDSESVQAVVYDYPVLLYYALQNEEKDYIVPGEAFNQEDYGIVVPTDSPLREEINLALLVLLENGTYDQIYNKWYGLTNQ